MKLKTEGGIMDDLIAVDNVLEKSLLSSSDDNNVVFIFLVEIIHLTNVLF